MAIDAKQLLKMSQQELDALFSAQEAGPIPDGEAKGTAIIALGTSSSAAIAEVINIFAWQGKVFDAKARLLRNHILPFGLKAIIARIYKALVGDFTSGKSRTLIRREHMARHVG
jgi:hypothetical protein